MRAQTGERLTVLFLHLGDDGLDVFGPMVAVNVAERDLKRKSFCHSTRRLTVSLAHLFL
jgi:hypothetical protein